MFHKDTCHLRPRRHVRSTEIGQIVMDKSYWNELLDRHLLNQCNFAQRHQAITWTNIDLLSTQSPATYIRKSETSWQISSKLYFFPSAVIYWWSLRDHPARARINLLHRYLWCLLLTIIFFNKCLMTQCTLCSHLFAPHGKDHYWNVHHGTEFISPSYCLSSLFFNHVAANNCQRFWGVNSKSQ